jgi:glycosyltransferase involved in cell wall biosynthesis
MASRNHILFWGSSYDRGLQYLLYMWPDVKKTFPDALLHICYGWDTFIQLSGNNPERMKWRETMVTMMRQPGIVDHGRVGKKELSEVRKQCGIWAYPTDFQEINCITALDVQSDGLVPVTMSLAALQETVGSGIRLDGDIRKTEIQQKYQKELIDLMGDEERWAKESKKAQKFAKGYDWKTISGEWEKILTKPNKKPLVSIITPTIREGWWRIMAENLASQTYENFEWLIVDDYKEDRSAVVEKYAKKYGLAIRYLRGNKTRRCGLVAANNIGWKASKGELLVWLQDFILIPDNGIEQLVDLHLHNPDAMIAPVDIYYESVKTDLTNKEDWWPGQKEVLANESWRNIRVKNQGIRESDNPYDYEANYGAIPKKVLDELNGWWEFMDDGLGYDNTEMAYRAMKLGYRLIVDDTNIAKCINLWPMIGGTPQNIVKRDRALNPPRWYWLQQQTEAGKLPIKRDEKLDQSISLPFEVPEEVSDEDCAQWIQDHAIEIVNTWKEVI